MSLFSLFSLRLSREDICQHIEDLDISSNTENKGAGQMAGWPLAGMPRWRKVRAPRNHGAG